MVFPFKVLTLICGGLVGGEEGGREGSREKGGMGACTYVGKDQKWGELSIYMVQDKSEQSLIDY